MHQIIIAWSFVFAVITMGVVMFFIITHFKNLEQMPESEPDTTARAPDLDLIFSENPQASNRTPGEEASLELVKRALANRDPALVSKFFRVDPTNEPEAVLEALDKLEATEGKAKELSWIGSQYANGTFIEQVVVNMSKDGQNVNRLAQLVAGSDGEWRIDFDSYIRNSSLGWEVILSENSPPATVRVFVVADTYYNGHFADDSVWQVYALVSPDVEKGLYGYVKRDSPQFRAMQKILEVEANLHRAVLEIKNSSNAGQRQFEITRVIAENWVSGDDPFDKSF
jgi:hypothetical protein